MDETTACLLCGGKAILKHRQYPGYREPDTFAIYHCSDCGTAFSLPRTGSSSIYENIYNNASRVPGYNRYMLYARYITRLNDPLSFLADSSEPYWGVKKALEDINHRKPVVLEVGSGLGYFTYALAKAGYNINGIDISESAVNQAKQRFGNHFICGDISGFAQGNAGRYDAVVSTEVIEHVDDPVSFINAALTLLKPGGKLIITTPNRSFYPSETVWASDLPPVHLWWFSEESVKYIATRTGTTATFIDYNGFYMDNYKSIRVDSGAPRPFFNSGGELIAPASKNEIKMKFRTIMAANPVSRTIMRFMTRNIRLLAGRMRKLSGKELRVCNERGLTMCAVFLKN